MDTQSGIASEYVYSIGIVKGKRPKFEIRGPGTALFDPGFGFLASRCEFPITQVEATAAHQVPGVFWVKFVIFC